MAADGKPGRPKSPPEKFYRRVTIRMTEGQLAEIKRRAALAGVSYNQYMRDCALKEMSEEIQKKRIEWFKNRSSAEFELIGAALEYEEEYFQDMLMNEYTEELSSVITTSIDGVEEIYYDDILPSDHTIDNWIFRNKSLNDCLGLCDYSERTIYIDIEKQKELDITLLHEMIHAYEFMLPEIYQQYITIRLFQKLQPQISNLMDLIHTDLHTVYRVHTLLFMLKSLDLDLRLNKPLGTVYSYGREGLFFNRG